MGQSIQEWTKSSFWKTAIKKFEVYWSAYTIFYRLSSTNFTYSHIMIAEFGTSHKVNSILLQPGKFADTRVVLSPNWKRSRRSLKLPKRAIIRPYKAGKRIGPEPLTFYENDAREFMMADQEVLSFLWIMCRKMCPFKCALEKIALS